ncbi:hypothetical protein BJX76DRAFT_257056 [Aspergillus varians]
MVIYRQRMLHKPSPSATIVSVFFLWGHPDQADTDHEAWERRSSLTFAHSEDCPVNMPRNELPERAYPVGVLRLCLHCTVPDVPIYYWMMGAHFPIGASASCTYLSDRDKAPASVLPGHREGGCVGLFFVLRSLGLVSDARMDHLALCGGYVDCGERRELEGRDIRTYVSCNVSSRVEDRGGRDAGNVGQLGGGWMKIFKCILLAASKRVSLLGAILIH